ncbi:flagellar hook assembly protein FlgD [Verminephrobacter aporrectodeae subsp. tuberculatae]|uniref:Basal-body rod modification protein FlgD n=1 Tax=Verminephrobacter aporrectodeae subsp. tuberculatae TaxID=1110392 RepID=A0ABT3KX01_9BURK|nr:flagellar hook capping FlgD N-terminal domain-containing protein [Verminephrobacter aporrectodeae]MCW5322846.1 flagellar hook assembly protein FlgD [Verminephrobacter aporrectodeae subsp. tuberculatae]
MIPSATPVPSALPATAAAAAKPPPGAKPQVGAAAAQERFLKLLVAQLNNQDPMNPLDNAQMTSQIAQISTVSGIEQLNQTVQGMAAQFGALQFMQGAALVGRSVLSEGSALAVAGKTGKGGFEIAAPATNVQVEVLTPGGRLLERLDLGAQAAGRHSFEWDASRYPNERGALQFRVTATAGANALESTPLSLSQVSAAGTDADGQLVLTLANGQSIGYRQIKALV